MRYKSEMTPDDIIRMAREAEVPVREHYDEQGLTPQELQRFAAIAIAAERKPLTDEEIRRIDDATPFHEGADWAVRFARAIERAHGIGGKE